MLTMKDWVPVEADRRVEIYQLIQAGFDSGDRIEQFIYWVDEEVKVVEIFAPNEFLEISEKVDDEQWGEVVLALRKIQEILWNEYRDYVCHLTSVPIDWFHDDGTKKESAGNFTRDGDLAALLQYTEADEFHDFKVQNGFEHEGAAKKVALTDFDHIYGAITRLRHHLDGDSVYPKESEENGN